MNAQLRRIQLMEAYMDEVTAALDAHKAPPAAPLQALAEYMDSGDWLRDYTADEAGLLPPALKRGVLSQDALYNLLTRCREMLTRNSP